MSTSSEIRILRISAFLIIILLGIAQAWATRHVIFSDGISYIEIASAYVQRDWANAINSYWSPLYSWLLALTLLVFRPGPYWQASMLHLVNFSAYVAGLLALELLLQEIVLKLGKEPFGPAGTLSRPTLYLASYTAYPVAALGILGYNSPDTISIALMLLLSALLLRVSRTGGSWPTFALIAASCALFYLARTGFAPSIPICIAIVMILLRRQQKPVLAPTLLMIALIAIIAGPFIIAISKRENRLTLGDSGKLTYGWEASGAVRFTHWQGEPGDIGTPLHPTNRVSRSPDAYVFDGPVGGTYPPWFDPTYWYAGIKPKLKPLLQVRVFLIDLKLATQLLLSSPITLPALILILHMGVTLWFRRFLLFWPVLLPAVTGLLLYCLVYIEKRYVASNLLVIWLVTLASIRVSDERWRYWGGVATQILCLIFFVYFVYSRALGPAVSSWRDLSHGREEEKNVNYLFAERLRKLGLRTGDKVAFIGIGTNADWARLDNVRIVGEIPVVWDRPQKLFNNYLIENADQIKSFWNADQLTQQRVLAAFRNAGAVMVVSDGLYNKTYPPEWQRVLSPEQIGTPRDKGDWGYQIRLRERYLWLIPQTHS